MKKIIYILLLPFVLFSCSTEDPMDNDDPSKDVTYNPAFSYTAGGTSYSSTSISVTFGGKTQMNILDGSGNLIADMSLPVPMDETISGKTFEIEFTEFEGNANFYINNEPHAMEGGTLNVTSNENSRVAGNFSGTAYKMDYSTTPATKGEAVQITNGSFEDCGI